MADRIATIERNTSETQILIELRLDGTGKAQLEMDCGFLKHMLELFAAHGRFDLRIRADGDRWVDDHHLTEDLAIALGQAFRTALGAGAGIARYGDIHLPMDEALVLVAVDISGRAALGYGLRIPTEKVGSFDTELVREFLTAFSRSLGASIHCHQIAGENAHHIIEACFKGLGRALSQAAAIDPRLEGGVPSTKGTLL